MTVQPQSAHTPLARRSAPGHVSAARLGPLHASLDAVLAAIPDADEVLVARAARRAPRAELRRPAWAGGPGYRIAPRPDVWLVW